MSLMQSNSPWQIMPSHCWRWGIHFDLANKKDRVEELDKTMEEPGFWDNPEKSTAIVQESKHLKDVIERYEKLCADREDMLMLIEIAEEENDTDMVPEVQESYNEFCSEYEAIRIETLLCGEYDKDNAILTLHAGAGGTESCDWASMLCRMYQRWAEKRGFQVEMLDFLDGDEAGLKSASILIEGENAYGFLKSESGVHRLVRVSPFDASGRRHTSFSAVEVMPEIDDNMEVDIRPEDIKMDVFRSSGAGGQHINKTSSAIRVTHIPTNTVVECQDERSQHKNKEKALSVLRSRLYEAEVEKQRAAIAADRKSQVGTGDRSERIRTYNFPQGRVTDHRIGLTLYQLDSILNGGLDPILDALIAADQAEKLRRSESSDKS